MTRRSLFSLLGLSWLPGVEPENLLRGTVTIPSDGDAAIAEAITEALRDLQKNSIYVVSPSGGVDGDWLFVIQGGGACMWLRESGEWSRLELAQVNA